MKIGRNIVIFILVTLLIVIALSGGFFIWHKYYSEKPIISPDISTPDGWIGTHDVYSGDINHFVFVKKPAAKNEFITAQIVVDAKRMDRSLDEWIRGYIDNNPAFTHIPFDPLQTWSLINGHLVLITEEQNTSSLTFHIFDKKVVYKFWFSPFGRWNEYNKFIYNTNDLKVVQAMVTDFISKFK